MFFINTFVLSFLWMSIWMLFIASVGLIEGGLARRDFLRSLPVLPLFVFFEALRQLPAFLLINFVIWLFNDTGLQPLSWFGWAG